MANFELISIQGNTIHNIFDVLKSWWSVKLINPQKAISEYFPHGQKIYYPQQIRFNKLDAESMSPIQVNLKQRLSAFGLTSHMSTDMKEPVFTTSTHGETFLFFLLLFFWAWQKHWDLMASESWPTLSFADLNSLLSFCTEWQVTLPQLGVAVTPLHFMLSSSRS